ncbi:MAG TPA: alpha/beta hydrolase [Thermoanaerobaculia bacterium]|nr:alpha/beta hydrolase [Thermoanaerobaculia bacterium]
MPLGVGRLAHRICVALLILAPLWPSSTGAAQQMTAAEVTALVAPPPDHRIAYGDDPLQFGHLRLPAGEGPHPVVLFLHGGCWLSRYDIAHVGALEEGLRAAGYAVWSVEYRRVGDAGGGWPGTFHDVGRGADHLRVLAARFPLDLSRLVVAGHSAGGHLALWLAMRSRIASGPLRVTDPVAVSAVVALAPAPALEALHAEGVCGGVIDRLMGGGPEQVPERYEAVSPMRAPPDVPQVLLIGAHDASWAPYGRAYAKATRAAPVSERLRVVEAPDAGHFEMIAPTSSTWPLVLAALEEAFATAVPER